MNKIIITTLAILITYSIVGQAPTTGQEKNYIEVTGIVEKQFPPNEIYVNVILKDRYDGKTKIGIQEQEDRLKSYLTKEGMDLKNLKLTDASASYYKIKWRTKDLVAQKQYTLLLHNASEVAKSFKVFDELDIKDADIEKISHSKMDSLTKEVRILAIKAAKNKAEYLTEAIGEHLGKALIISEGQQFELPNKNIGRFYLNESEISNNEYHQYVDKDEYIDQIDIKSITIKYSIYTKFELLK